MRTRIQFFLRGKTQSKTLFRLGKGWLNLMRFWYKKYIINSCLHLEAKILSNFSLLHSLFVRKNAILLWDDGCEQLETGLMHFFTAPLTDRNSSSGFWLLSQPPGLDLGEGTWNYPPCGSARGRTAAGEGACGREGPE